MQSFSPSYSRSRGNRQLFARTSLRVSVLAIVLCSLAAIAGLLLSQPPVVSAVTTVPTKMNFQGRLTDASGNIKPNGTYNMRLKLYAVASAGTSVWSEDRLVSATQGVTVTNGLFSIQLGSITTLPASLFASGALYLEIELPTPASATSFSPVWTEGPMTPRNQMATSAYAYNSETLDGQDGAWYQDAANLTGTVSGARLSGSYTSITGTGALAAGSITTGFGTILTGNTISGSQLISTITTGTAPLTVTSTTLVANLNADFLDGQSGAYYQSATNLNAGTIASARVTGSYTGVTGVGTLTAGTWQGSAVAVQYGGTGATSFTSNGILYGNGTGAVATTAAGTTGQCLVATTSAAPSWGACGSGGATLAGNNIFTGANTFRNTSNSTSAFSIQNSSSNSLLTADTTNMRLSIGGAAVTYSRIASASQPKFEFNGEYPATYSPSSMVSRDFNADGINDLAAVETSNSSGSNGTSVAIMLNSGGGTFPTVAKYTVQSYPKFLISHDFNADSRPDLAVSNDSSSGFQILMNNGDGTFAAAVSYGSAGYYVRGIAGGDYDVDGDIDVVVSMANVGGIYVFMNNGNGTFAAAVAYTGTNTSSVCSGKFNNDSAPDIVSFGNSLTSSAKVFMNNGNGTFANPVSYSMPSNGSSGPQNCKTGDINGDGIDDIVVGVANNVAVYINNGSGTFANYVTYGTTTPSSIELADIDGDNEHDVVAISNARVLSILRGVGNGTFAAGFSVNAFNGSTSVVAAHFNIDDKLDLAVANLDTGGSALLDNVVILLNDTKAEALAENSTGSLSVTVASPSAGGIFIKAASLQTASLLTIQDASGVGLFSVDAAGNLRTKGTISGGVNAPDYAENITASDLSIEAADVIAMDPNSKEQVIKSSQPYQITALGVISTNPGFVTNATAPGAVDGTQRALALSGRVPVKVTNENGSIGPGDYLTSSSTPGYAMKATQPGPTIGRAMEGFDSESGKVLMFIDNSYYNPTDGQHLQGSDGLFTNLVISGQLKTGDLIVTGSATFEGDIIVNAHIVSGGEVPAIIAIDDTCISTTIDGNDVTGSISLTTKPGCRPTGKIVTITFAKEYTKSPRIVLSPSNENAAKSEYYKGSTTKEAFELHVATPLFAETHYIFDYMIIE